MVDNNSPFVIKGQQVSQTEFFRASLAIAKKNGGEVRLPLEILLGFDSIGQPFRPEPYGPLGLPHPRPASYYRTDSERFSVVLAGIESSGAIDDAITIWPLVDHNCFAVLDGLTRASCASILRAQNSLLFGRVNCRLFVGDVSAARLEMIARNWAGRKSELTAIEQVQSVARMRYDWQLDFDTIAKALGRPPSYKPTLSRMASFAVDATPAVRDSLACGNISLSAALELGSADATTQNTLAEQGASVAAVKAAKAATRDDSKPRPGRKPCPIKALDKASEAIEAAFGYLDKHHPASNETDSVADPFREQFADFFDRLKAEVAAAKSFASPE